MHYANMGIHISLNSCMLILPTTVYISEYMLETVFFNKLEHNYTVHITLIFNLAFNRIVSLGE